MKIPVIDMENTGRNLRMLCRRKGLCVRELQTILNLGSVQSVYDWYHGRTLPSVDNLLALSVLLGVPMEQLLIVHGDRRITKTSQKCPLAEKIPKHLKIYYQKGQSKSA